MRLQHPAGQELSRPGVVLLHGFFSAPLLLWPLAARLRAAGYRTFAPLYPSWRYPLAQLVEQLEHRISAFSRGSSAPLHFVGHSMGGLIARALIARARPDHLGRVVMLGTPNSGSEIADALSDHPTFRLLLGQAAPALVSRRTALMLRALGTVDYPVGVIAGDRAMFPGPLTRHLPAPHDGKVSVAATHIDGESDHLLLPLNHTTLTLSRQAHRQVLHFLTNGRFDHGCVTQVT